MRIVLLFICFLFQFVGSAQIVRMNAANNGNVYNLTCPVSGRFADSGSGSTHYDNNRDDTLTFCADVGKLLKFDFGCGSNLTIERIDPTDTLFIYDGPSVSSPLLYAVTGNAGNSDRLPYFDETSDFTMLASSRCITFRFKTDGSNNNDGWDACVSCVDSLACGANEPATDLFGGAPYICNNTDYCGNTSSDFGEDYPVDLNPNGGNCPSSKNFLGTIENNSWLKFIADSTGVIFDFSVTLGGGCSNGIQAAILSYDGSSLTRMSDCSLSDGSHSGNFQLTATGLTVGETYYIMTDGNTGDDCDFTIGVNAGVNLLDAGAAQEVCAGDPVSLAATGPSAATYIWNSTDGVVVNVGGANQTFNPLVPTTYYVTISGGGVCEDQVDTVNVSICVPLPIELAMFDGECKGDAVELNWSTGSEMNNDYFEIQKAGENFVFQSIGRVRGAGNSSVALSYTFVDNEANQNDAYYRLKQVDFNNYFSYSNILSVSNCVGNKDQILAVGFLSKNEIEINYLSSVHQNMKVLVYDIQGRLVGQKQLEVDQGVGQSALKIERSVGVSIYLVHIVLGDVVITEKLFVTQ